MQPGRIFINTSRGSVVDEAALLEAIDCKGLKAGLDVFDIEPMQPQAEFKSKLANHPNVIGTHHVGAGTLQVMLESDKLLSWPSSLPI